MTGKHGTSILVMIVGFVLLIAGTALVLGQIADSQAAAAAVDPILGMMANPSVLGLAMIAGALLTGALVILRAVKVWSED